MSRKDPWTKKVVNVRYLYGEAAATYLEANSKCERCGEARIAVLNVHHTNGKHVEAFETLCFNCHLLEHANNPEYTHEQHLRRTEEAQRVKDAALSLRTQRRTQGQKLVAEGFSLRQAAEAIGGISHVTLRTYLRSPS